VNEFKPPKPNQAIIWLCELLLPAYLRYVDRLQIDYCHNFDRLHELVKNKPTVFMINHPDRQDPLIVVALAKYARETLYCITAREVFEWNHGLRGWLFQRFGCYSMDRGAIDFCAIHTTQALLSERDANVIVFPEGEVTGDDQQVGTFDGALFHLILAAQQTLSKHDPAKSICIVPVGVSYTLESKLEESIEPVLCEVEKRLCLVPTKSKLQARVDTAVITVLDELAHMYRITTTGNLSSAEKAEQLAYHICQSVASYLGCGHRADESVERFLHRLRTELAESPRTTDNRYSKRLAREQARILDQFLVHLDRAERLLIFNRVLKHETSDIQVCRIVDFLEMETCGRMSAKGKQRAFVQLGTPIEVQTYSQTYQNDKKDGVQKLTAAVHEGLQAAVNESHGHPNVSVAQVC
jgi:1-acyl-sn-glycerol-3-phosphate acyltransferase